MSELLDEKYLTWLYSQVGSVKVREPDYWSLLQQLYRTEFVWFVPNDDNRVEDGRDLRHEFFEIYDIDSRSEQEWLELGCSVLELLIGLSRRLQFEAEGTVKDWFWLLIDNLSLTEFNQTCYRRFSPEERVEELVGAMIWRTYDPDGRGGLFPLSHPDKDQRDVEIWYQLCAYVLEL